ncbi:MAG: hypothetical protein JWP55_5324, partial [Mycobacterium sp.]|nr:hypothetical protein [Mycobacterium sp.]
PEAWPGKLEWHDEVGGHEWPFGHDHERTPRTPRRALHTSKDAVSRAAPGGRLSRDLWLLSNAVTCTFVIRSPIGVGHSFKIP